MPSLLPAPALRRAGLVAAACALALSACSGGSDDVDPAATSTPEAAASATESATAASESPTAAASDTESEDAGATTPAASEEPDEPSPTEEAAADTTGTIDGHWCPTEGSGTPTTDCMTVALPQATLADGTVIEVSGGYEVDGGIQYDQVSAPFGTFYPAGVEIDIPDYYGITDVPDVDRIWNSQTGDLFVRG